MNVFWKLTDNYFSLEFDNQVRTLSSSILGGGFNSIKSFINLKVGANLGGRDTGFPPPQQTISEIITKNGLPLPAAGMMTAASMNSFQYSVCSFEGVDVYCFLTSGLSNALAAGDPGEFKPQRMFSDSENSRFGTINIVVGVSCPLSDAAMAEALMVLTEAKSSVLFELGVKSVLTGNAATGTGTDSVLVFSPHHEACGQGAVEQFCGKHTILGELIAGAVRKALFESLKNDMLFN